MATRYVLGLGTSNDAFGHGITELSFETERIVVRAGRNEDYLVVERGPFDAGTLDMSFWAAVNLTEQHHWQPTGRLRQVDVFTDGVEDIALVFEFDEGDRFSLVLCDTDLAIGRSLERFELEPVLRVRVTT